MKEDEAAVKPTLVYDGENIDHFGEHAVGITNIREWHPDEIWRL